MNRTIRGLITFFVVVIILLVGLIVYYINQGTDSSFGERTLVNEKNFSMNEIKEIDLSHYSDDLFLYESDSDEIIVKEYKSKEYKDSDQAIIETKGSELTIQGQRQNIGIRISKSNDYMELYLPSTYHGTLNLSTSSGMINISAPYILSDCNISSTSGDILIEEITADRILISTTSGEVLAKKLQGDRIVSTSSGDIILQDGAGNTSANTISGEINISDFEGYIEAETSSGDIKLLDGKGDTQVNTISGAVYLKYIDAKGIIDINTNSGDVTASIPEETKLRFHAKTTSGDIHTFFDRNLTYNKKGNLAEGEIGSNFNMELNVQTGSGEVLIHSN